jgi:hypothetical protein
MPIGMECSGTLDVVKWAKFHGEQLVGLSRFSRNISEEKYCRLSVAYRGKNGQFFRKNMFIYMELQA